jgi:hypothetical protein
VSILEHGIVSRNYTKKKRLPFVDISEEGVQDRRVGKKVLGTNKELHDYANLYFDAHNPMLCARQNKNSEICVLKISKDVLDVEDVILTDKNAARAWDPCWFKPVAEGLPLLDKDRIFATWWTEYDDEYEKYKHAGEKCAEVLVPDLVRANLITGAYVANQLALKRFQEKITVPVEINRAMFF